MRSSLSLRSASLALACSAIFTNSLTAAGDQPESVDDSLRIKIGQMILIGFRGLEVDRESPIYRDVSELGVGGVILFDYDVPTRKPERNIESPEQVRALAATLQEWSEIPLLIAVDQEGGLVARLKPAYGFPRSVSAQYLGELDNVDSTRHYADLTARSLSNAGINLNFAPVVDLNSNPENPIVGKIGRSYSADPAVVSRHAAIVVSSHADQGIATALKHFPGHGSSTNDTHLGLVDVTETWDPTELQPYKTLIESGLANGVMTAHVVNRQLDEQGISSTLSSKVIDGVLRDELGFDGVVYSDDLQMGAIRDHYDLSTVVHSALQAGVDVLTFANNSVFEESIAEQTIEIIHELVSSGQVTTQRIDESYSRIIALKKRFARR